MTGATTGIVPGLPGRYRIEKKLAETAHSDVYVAVDDVLGRQVAIKVMRSCVGPAQRAAFVESGRIVAGLRDGRVVVIHDGADPLDGRAWSAMQYHPKGSLADEIRSSGPLPVARVLQVADVLAGVLAALYRDRRVLHRDLKPSNVLVHADGSVALADFRMAAAAPGPVGTPASSSPYAAPEVGVHGGHDVPSEVYALAATLVEALCGTNPLARRDGETEQAFAHRRATGGLPDELRARDLPAPLSTLLTRMLAADPARRPATWDEVAAALRDLPSAESGSAPGERQTGPEIAAASATETTGTTDGPNPTRTTPTADGDPATEVAERAYTAPDVATSARRRGRPLLAVVAALAVVAVLGLGWMVTTTSRASPLASLPAAPIGQTATTATSAQSPPLSSPMSPPPTSAPPPIPLPTAQAAVATGATAIRAAVKPATRTRRLVSAARPPAPLPAPPPAAGRPAPGNATSTAAPRRPADRSAGPPTSNAHKTTTPARPGVGTH